MEKLKSIYYFPNKQGKCTWGKCMWEKCMWEKCMWENVSTQRNNEIKSRISTFKNSEKCQTKKRRRGREIERKKDSEIEQLKESNSKKEVTLNELKHDVNILKNRLENVRKKTYRQDRKKRRMRIKPEQSINS